MRFFVGDITGYDVDDADRSVLGAVDGAPSLPRLRFDCGDADPLVEPNRALHASLVERGIEHEYAEHPGGHEWSYWSAHLGDALR